MDFIYFLGEEGLGFLILNYYSTEQEWGSLSLIYTTTSAQRGGLRHQMTSYERLLTSQLRGAYITQSVEQQFSKT